MSVLAPQSCTNAYQNGGRRLGGEMSEVIVPHVPLQRRYTLNEDFFEVLREVGAVKDKPYEWKDVIMLFLRYLAKRKPSLFDPDNKSRVLCGRDPLGAVFGVQHFSKEETRLLVRQHISLVEDDLPPLPPFNPAGPSSPIDDEPDRKRSRPEEEEAAGAGAGAADGSGPSAEPPVPLHRRDTLDVADCVGVGDGAPPAAAEGDSVSCDEMEDHRRTYAREMEPVECDTEGSGADSSGESDVESPLGLTVLTAWADDVGMLADLDETSESDSEQRDTWACSAPDCQHANSARKSRCDRCWKTRTAWIIGPRRRKKRERDQARQQSQLNQAAAPAAAPADSSQDTGYGSQEASAVSPPPPVSPPDAPPAHQICLICCEKRRDAAIIHGRTGCQVTCYGCARKLWKRRDLCPSCRRRIQKIVFMRFG